MLLGCSQFASPNPIADPWFTCLVRYAVAVLLFAAAVSKALYPSQAVSLEQTHRLPEWFGITIILLECMLGILVLSGLWQHQVMRIALTVFAVFAGLSFYRAAIGAESCGCFGSVRVNPWVTFALDLGIVAALCVARPMGTPSSNWSAPRLATALGAYALVVVALLAWMHHPAQIAAAGSVGREGQLVILEPETWLGKPFPLVQYIDTDAELARGEWLIVLHRHDCAKCADAVPRYAMLANRYSSRPGRPTIALVEVPPFGAQYLHEELGVFCGRVRDDREWFVQTPLEIRLQDGVVQRASHDLPALAELNSHPQPTIDRVAFDP